MHTVILKEGREKSVLRHHPWIFSGAVREVTGNPGPGETVEVRNARGEFLAHGAYAAESHIPVKLWNFTESEAIDEAFFRKEVYQYIYACGIYEGYDIPRELMAQVTADVILDVYEWVYIKGNETPREEIDLSARC